MMALTPDYRVLINRNLALNPLFFDFLKRQFNLILSEAILQKKLDLSEVYKFTIYSIPAGWGALIIRQVGLMDEGIIPETPKLKKISDILHALDPTAPQPVDIEFTLGEIISFIKSQVRHFQEVTPGGIVHYFGIEYYSWFDDYPIQTGIVLRAVDFGTLDNFPHHLFDDVFNYIRAHLLDLFIVFNKTIQPEESGMVKNVNVQEL